MLRVIALSLCLLVTACGSDSGKKRPVARSASPQKVETTDQEPFVPTNAGMVGTWEQVENRQARIVINEGLLVTSNVSIPVDISGSSETRLTPKFPQQLRRHKDGQYYHTIGYFNDGLAPYTNVELRVALHESGNSLDVTFVLPEREQGGPGASELDPLPGCGPCCFPPCGPCGPCLPCDPCAPYWPCQPCRIEPNPCPQPNAGEGEEWELCKNKFIVYRFERSAPEPGEFKVPQLEPAP